MIKITDDKNPLIVDFTNASNKSISGKLLTYEIFGEACILVDSKKVWIPFSKLSAASRTKILGKNTTVNGRESTHALLKDPKLLITITLLVLVVFSYQYLKFSL